MTEISAGAFRSLALTEGGRVLAWDCKAFCRPLSPNP